MFTGLVEETGVLKRIQPLPGGRRLTVGCHLILSDLKVGDSVSLNGVCQTVVSVAAGAASFDAVGDTLTKTTLGNWSVGTLLNLERACRADTRLGGHIVQGHVQTTARVVGWSPRASGWELTIELLPGWQSLVMAEGSVAVDGISLTVAEVTTRLFRISVIPHTVAETNLKILRVGQRVNLEADVFQRALTLQTLNQWGYT